MSKPDDFSCFFSTIAKIVAQLLEALLHLVNDIFLTETFEERTCWFQNKNKKGR